MPCEATARSILQLLEYLGHLPLRSSQSSTSLPMSVVVMTNRIPSIGNFLPEQLPIASTTQMHSIHAPWPNPNHNNQISTINSLPMQTLHHHVRSSLHVSHQKLKISRSWDPSILASPLPQGKLSQYNSKRGSRNLPLRYSLLLSSFMAPYYMEVLGGL